MMNYYERRETHFLALQKIVREEKILERLKKEVQYLFLILESIFNLHIKDDK